MVAVRNPRRPECCSGRACGELGWLARQCRGVRRLRTRGTLCDSALQNNKLGDSFAVNDTRTRGCIAPLRLHIIQQKAEGLWGIISQLENTQGEGADGCDSSDIAAQLRQQLVRLAVGSENKAEFRSRGRHHFSKEDALVARAQVHEIGVGHSNAGQRLWAADVHACTETGLCSRQRGGCNQGGIFGDRWW